MTPLAKLIGAEMIFLGVLALAGELSGPTGLGLMMLAAVPGLVYWLYRPKDG